MQTMEEVKKEQEEIRWRTEEPDLHCSGKAGTFCGRKYRQGAGEKH